ncbi:hypothetical protein SAMN05880590_102760 [Rhizobium sp. RU35A]|uniref:hypothetical protein n=1 Tax=Rhizobium sp. RU35A TaxID=1907414 RepID=UPI0009542175|nr:hypothetical protein [Rhizobium sp. RU35A]SIQ24308.1 hypothetical protein SAMN05880590_102760 [Rhizobium sp. RU35A]
MAIPLPLIDAMELAEIRRQREELQRKLQRGGVDVRTRLRREARLRHLTAQQIEIELRLKHGSRT